MGAHYDDVEIGVGGTLLKHVQNGDEVFIVIIASDEHRTGDIVTRHQEQIDSLNILGIDEQHLVLFKINDELSDIVESLDKIKPDLIYTMFELDTHQSHRKCSIVGQAAGRRVFFGVVFYNSGTSYDFLPTVFSEISCSFKRKLLNCFKSQIELKTIDIDTIQKRESYWASLLDNKFNHAEGFVIRKMIYKI